MGLEDNNILETSYNIHHWLSSNEDAPLRVCDSLEMM